MKDKDKELLIQIGRQRNLHSAIANLKLIATRLFILEDKVKEIQERLGIKEDQK